MNTLISCAVCLLHYSVDVGLDIGIVQVSDSLVQPSL